jgi:hypothetical protein
VRGEVVVTADIHDDARFTFELDGELTSRKSEAR